MEEATKGRSGSGNRRRSEIIMVRVTREEHVRLQEHARQSGLRTATYLRQSGLGSEATSKTDRQSIQNLAQLHGDLARVRGLLQSWLSRSERQGFGVPMNMTQALGQLRQLLHQLYKALEKL
ncbi:MAG: conjugal transfer protein TraJ [Halieaceae bacterium]|nr:conjugal transfer protein TraJ [Halieaceae bacterium]